MMSQMFNAQRYSQVLELLDAERKIILNGPLTDLGAVVEKREEIMTALLKEKGTLPQAFITALKARAERNSRLIKASIDGIKYGRVQVKRIEETAGRLHTYDAAGTKTEVTADPTTRDKKA
ncbi:hypothetical protein [Amaricoccus tamworthensis]|uniref:hypothetical protein n=1 Tax=Amaricoccus tamworthensis TaxID=57002 RepID=UPI003C7A9EB9